MASNSPSSPTPRIVIIGAGCGGLSFAIALTRKYGYQNYVIYERASDIGGAWRENTYPGCSSDVKMHFFSLSTDLRNWRSTHGYQPEILSYWRDLAHKYALLPHIRFNHRVLSAEWDDDRQSYHVAVRDDSNGATHVVQAQIVISAVGILDVPHWPKMRGMEKFKGNVFHSARWDAEVELKGKNVGVVGNGPSAVQLAPRISEDQSVHVVNFIRTPSWLVPSEHKRYSNFRIWLMGTIPGALRIIRIMTFLVHEVTYLLVFGNPVTRRGMQSLCKRYIQSKAPEKYREKLTPTFDLGCKRTLFDTEYLDSLHRPNVSVCFDGIKEVVEDGIITKKDEKLPLDVIILATGFITDDYAIPVKGRNHQTIGEYYHASGGPTAYLGTSIPGFPNFYTLLGPNIATGFTSIIYSHELQIDYMLQLIKPVLDGKATAFDVTSRANDEYNTKIQKRFDNSVFMQCMSWYRTGGNGKVSNIFPGSGTLLWWWLRRPVWDHYTVTNGQRWEKERKRRRTLVSLAVVVGVLAIGLAYFRRYSDILI